LCIDVFLGSSIMNQGSIRPGTKAGAAPRVAGADPERVTVWNRTEQRKIAGKAAPMAKNLQKFLAKHPDYEVYSGQDEGMTKVSRKRPRDVSVARGMAIQLWVALSSVVVSSSTHAPRVPLLVNAPPPLCTAPTPLLGKTS
jgi:hypothetical protein